MTLRAGYLNYIRFQPNGASTPARIDVHNSAWKEAVDLVDVTHTGTAGIQALLPTILRGDGSAKMTLDDAAVISNDPYRIRAGVSGNIEVTLGTATPFYIPVTIAEVAYTSEVAGKVEWGVTFRLNFLAGSVSYAYPT